MSTVLMRARDLIGEVVVDASTGDDLAEVKDVLFDASRGTITGFTLRKRGTFGRRMKTILPIDGVLAVGPDAVMVDGADSLTHPNDAPDDTVAEGAADVLHDTVITESGRVLGTVKDVVVLGGPAPRVVAFEIGGGAVGSGLVPLAARTSVSGSALIVPDAYEQRIRTDLTGLAAELTDIDRARQ